VKNKIISAGLNQMGFYLYCSLSKYIHYMKKFTLPALLITLACTSAQAQTKRIAHRSHSGTNAHFSLWGSDNFGNPPANYKLPNATIDSTQAASEGAKKAGDPSKSKARKKNRTKKPKMK
jgi:hypothetical protein